MTTMPAVAACPFCQRPLKAQFHRIYGHSVCSKCYYAFANRRQLAFVIDRVVWILPTIALGFVIGIIVVATGGKVTPEVARTVDLLGWPMYIVFLFKDSIRGYSPGKWLCGVQVIDVKTRQPIGPAASLKRNLPLFIPIVPLIIAFQLQRGKRWGDGWANSMVIWKKFENSYVFGAAGNCEACNYDLRGNVSGVCPECGTPVSAANRAFLQMGAPVAVEAQAGIPPMPPMPPTSAG